MREGAAAGRCGGGGEGLAGGALGIFLGARGLGRARRPGLEPRGREAEYAAVRGKDQHLAVGALSQVEQRGASAPERRCAPRARDSHGCGKPGGEAALARSDHQQSAVEGVQRIVEGRGAVEDGARARRGHRTRFSRQRQTPDARADAGRAVLRDAHAVDPPCHLHRHDRRVAAAEQVAGRVPLERAELLLSVVRQAAVWKEQEGPHA